jgi:hypothetical protein
MWTRAHREWLHGRRLEHVADQDILADHLLALEQNEGRLAALDEKLAHWSTQAPYAEPVAWLRCFRGIDTLTALSVVAAWHYRHRPSVGYRLAKRRIGQPAQIIAIADRAQQRLHSRYARMSARGKRHNLVIAAVGRELVGFLWAAMQRTEIPSA